jgi:hypothetical protein
MDQRSSAWQAQLQSSGFAILDERIFEGGVSDF